MSEGRSDRPHGSPKGEDVVLVHGVTEDGKGYQVLRKRGSELALGAVRPLEDGKPIHGELVRLRRREEAPVLFDVLPAEREQTPDGEPASETSVHADGPARVSTDAYRSGWENIWGARRRRSGKALPN